MKTVVCTMCGSTDIVKKGDLFVCQYCDTVFEAQEDLEGKDGSGSGEPSSDDPTINNYLVLAQVALDAGNLSEAEGYLKTILEKDATQSKAWFLRGIVAAFSSTVENSRLMEAVEYIGRSFYYVPDCAPEKNKLQSDVSELLMKIFHHILNEACEKFSASCTPEDAGSIARQLRDVLSSLLVLHEKYGIDIRGFSAEETERIDKVAVDAYNKCFNKFAQLTYPNYVDWEEFITRSYVVLYLLDVSISVIIHDDDLDRIRYRSKINILNNLLNSYFYNADGNRCSYGAQHKAEIKQQIAECVGKIKEIDEILGPQSGGEEVPPNAEAANANLTAVGKLMSIITNQDCADCCFLFLLILSGLMIIGIFMARNKAVPMWMFGLFFTGAMIIPTVDKEIINTSPDNYNYGCLNVFAIAVVIVCVILACTIYEPC